MKTHLQSPHAKIRLQQAARSRTANCYAKQVTCQSCRIPAELLSIVLFLILLFLTRNLPAFLRNSIILLTSFLKFETSKLLTNSLVTNTEGTTIRKEMLDSEALTPISYTITT